MKRTVFEQRTEGERTLYGNQLTYGDQRDALFRYIHRFTGDHKPQWAYKRRGDGTAYPVQFANDIEWLAHTRFVVTQSGRLHQGRRDCFSTPTYPNNPELRTPGTRVKRDLWRNET